MSSSHTRGAPISDLLPCSECGKLQMIQTVEAYRLADGVTGKRLRHYKCGSCGSCCFDDDAMDTIQRLRASLAASAPAR